MHTFLWKSAYLTYPNASCSVVLILFILLSCNETYVCVFQLRTEGICCIPTKSTDRETCDSIILSESIITVYLTQVCTRMYPVLNYITENYVAYICHIWLAKDDNLMLLNWCEITNLRLLVSIWMLNIRM